MPSGQFDPKTPNRPGGRIFVMFCVVVFVVIAACAAYFVFRTLA